MILAFKLIKINTKYIFIIIIIIIIMSNLRKSEFNSSKTQRFATSKDYQLFKSQLYSEKQKIQSTENKISRFNQQKIENLSQTENFYLPIMKQVYNQNKDKLQGKIKPPQQLFKKPQIRQFTIDTEQRRNNDLLRRQNQSKQNKIKELIIKCNHLYNKLKLFMKDEQINMDVQTLSDDNEKKIKRLENLLRIKNQEVFFKIKVQASNLLQQFQVEKNQIEGINQLESQNAIFEFLISKLKLKLKDFKSKERQSNQSLQKDRILQEKSEQTIHFLTQTNQILKSSELRAKQKLQEIKNQRQNLYQKLSIKQRQLEQKENEIFKLKKVYEESQNLILKVSANQRQLNAQIQQQKRQSDTSLRQLRMLLSNYNLQKRNLVNLLQQKQDQIEEMSIREKYTQQQFDKVNREYTRWKQRYEWLQKQKQTKCKNYEQEIQSILQQFNEYKIIYNSAAQQAFKSQIETLTVELSNYKLRIQQYEDQLNYQNSARVQQQQLYYKKIQDLEAQYFNKYSQFESIKTTQMNNFIQQKQKEVSERVSEQQKNFKIKIEQLQALHKTKFFQFERQFTENINELSNENYNLKDQLIQLKLKLQQKDKLITILYPSVKIESPKY